MSRITDLIKNFVSPANDETQPTINPNNASRTPGFAGNKGAWTNAITNNLIADGDRKRSIAKEYNGGSVDVPVYESDAQWDAIKRSLEMFADQAHLSGNAKTAFVKKWTNELEQNGQTSIYSNATGVANDDAAFAAKINSKTADKAAGLRGTYKMTIKPDVQTGMINDLKALRSAELSTARIKNADLRKQVKADLQNVVVGSGDEKTNAAANLLNRAAKNQPEAEAVYQAVKATANRADQQQNAALKMTELRMDAAKQREFVGAIADPEQQTIALQIRIQEAVMLAEKSDLPANTSASGKADRREAAWVNKQAAVLSNEIGDAKNSAFYEMTGRFYEVDKEERESTVYPIQKSVPRWKETGEGEMRADTKEEKALREFKAENDVTEEPYMKRELQEGPWKYEYKSKGKGTPKAAASRSDYVEGLIEAPKGGQVAVYDEKGRPIKNLPMDYSKKIKDFKPEMNRSGAAHVRLLGNATQALEVYNTWMPLLFDLKHGYTLEKIQTRERLTKEEQQATHYLIPPRPEELPKVRQQFEQQLGKEKSALMLRKLEELSNAYWSK